MSKSGDRLFVALPAAALFLLLGGLGYWLFQGPLVQDPSSARLHHPRVVVSDEESTGEQEVEPRAEARRDVSANPKASESVAPPVETVFAGQVVIEGTERPLESGLVEVMVSGKPPLASELDPSGRFRIAVGGREPLRQAWLHVSRWPDHPHPLHDGRLGSALVLPGEDLRIEIPDLESPALSALVGHLEFAGEPCERGYIVLRARGDRAMAHQNGYLSGNRVEVFVPSRAGPFTDEVPGPLVLSLVDFGNLHARWSFASFTELRASLGSGLRGPEHAVRLKLDAAPQALPPSALVWAVGEEGEARERRIDESG